MADTYWRFEINGVSDAQVQTAVDWIAGLDQDGVTIMSFEHTPVAGNEQIGQNVFRGNIGGPDISGMRTRVINKIVQQTGNPPDVDEVKESPLEAIKTAYQLYGDSLANRPALKIAIFDIWKNGARCLTGADSEQLLKWMKARGFKSKKDLKAWLNETP